NSTPFKRALEQCETKKRRLEHVPRSPYVEKRCKTSDVTSLEDMLKGRKYLPVHTPLMAEMLVQVKPWVEV
ncbi:hypothetical protein, partial [Salmonella enterica]|uniref:hypothetical protein n=1 Tax=Salmonella enterica TaxID=28901 RepID=UPI0020C51813